MSIGLGDSQRRCVYQSVAQSRPNFVISDTVDSDLEATYG